MGAQHKLPNPAPLKCLQLLRFIKHFKNRIISFKGNASILLLINFVTAMMKMMQGSGHFPKSGMINQSRNS